MKKLFVVVCMFNVLLAQAQVRDTLHHLHEVVVSTSRFDQFNTGSNTLTLDSTLSSNFKHQTIADLLQFQSQVFIKSYGSGLSTTSFRGAAAEHTAVMWKGFNLQSPLNGQVDLSLIPNDVAENATIQYGGNGALFGSGAIGGIIQLQSTAHYNSGLHGSAGAQLGSFNHLRKQASISFGNNKWYSTAKFFELQARNNFEYTNTFLPEKPTMRMRNADIFQRAFVNEHYIKITPKQELNLNYWFQYTDRNIPPTMSVPVSKAYQKDISHKVSAEWKLAQQRILWLVRTGYFDETIDYTNPVSVSLNGTGHSKTSISEAEMRVQLNTNHSLNIGVNNTYINAISNGYNGRFAQNRLAGFVSYKIQGLIPKLTTTISIREEFVYNTNTPTIPAVGVEWKAIRWLTVMGNISKSFRLPTFNELYWRSVEFSIKPETGWNKEMTVKFQQTFNNITTNASITGFTRNIENWIVWQPSGIDWAPQNLKKVWSRGLETQYKIQYRLNKWLLSYNGMANYILSTTTETNAINAESLGKQLIYVPRITHQHQLLATFSTWHLGILQSYTGLRFTATDNSDWLNAYSLTNIIGGKEIKYKKIGLVLSAQVQNALNTTYQAVADRPMPGRNYLLTTTLKF